MINCLLLCYYISRRDRQESIVISPLKSTAYRNKISLKLGYRAVNARKYVRCVRTFYFNCGHGSRIGQETVISANYTEYMELKFCATCGEYQNYILKSRFRIDTSCLIATCNRHEHAAERLIEEDVSTTYASKIRKSSRPNCCQNCVITGCVCICNV